MKPVGATDSKVVVNSKKGPVKKVTAVKKNGTTSSAQKVAVKKANNKMNIESMKKMKT